MDSLEKEIDKAFSAFHGTVWQSLSEEKKKEIVYGIAEILRGEDNELKLKYLDDAIQDYKRTQWDLFLLFFGVVLGISGNLIANMIDRQFVELGLVYDISILAVFLLFIWYVDRKFLRKNPAHKNPIAERLYELTKNIPDT